PDGRCAASPAWSRRTPAGAGRSQGVGTGEETLGLCRRRALGGHGLRPRRRHRLHVRGVRVQAGAAPAAHLRDATPPAAVGGGGRREPRPGAPGPDLVRGPRRAGKLDALLSAGTPALLTVGKAGLPWHEGVDPMEAYDPYDVVVAGKDGDAYLVDDCGESLERASAAELGRAWSLHKKGRFAVRTFAVPEGGPKDTATAVRSAVRSAVSTTVAHMTGPVLGNAFDVNFGLSGIEKWAAEVADVRTKRGWRTRFGAPAAFRHAMGRVVDCFTPQYGSPGATRPLYAEFLREADAATPLDLDAAAGAAAASARLWEEVVAVAAAADEPEAAFTAIGALAERLVAAERRLVERLEAAIAA